MMSTARQAGKNTIGSAMPALSRASDVARILGVSTKTVHKLVRENKLACVPVIYREQRCFRVLRMLNEGPRKTMWGEGLL
jgi:hypothetical protein